ncbi:WD40 repeat [Fusarium oxysporum f. sp. vasinfectum]|nr:WD40 repeat [Fusarium oxysporum f. sp. vasinfectum]
MPSFDQLADAPKKGKVIKSAYESESFESDGTIHVDGLVGSATISPAGRDVALASPDGLAIIDLDSPYSPPRRLRTHGLPWLVVDVQWSPFAARDYWIVSAANHRALVWNLNRREDSSSGAIEHSLQGHSRAITDVNWSAHHPDLLSTCSVDGYIHAWDLRRPRQPVLTFCDWTAGASQVKYNRQASHILASAHDRWLHIWDERRSSEPLKSIKAHKSKIYGLDWNRSDPKAIVSCSIDKRINFWDYTAEEPLQHTIETGFPVWRARHTPFGHGLLAIPQNEPGDLYLYDTSFEPESKVTSQPIDVWPGHGDHKAKEFLWRCRGGITDDGKDNREFQLVSWGTDNELKLQCIDPKIFAAIGHKRGMPADPAISITRKGATYKTFRAVDESTDRDRKSATMSDHRPGTSYHKQSALTLGMRSGTTQSHRASMAWRGPSMKAKVSGRSVDRNQSQIGWMKGIAMTKRKASTSAKRHLSKDSGIFGHGYPDDEWAEPESIQEELLRISHQLPKVRWDNIDMDSLTLNASLNGPWGADGETIFIKVRIDIPVGYPKTRAPKFYVEKSSFMPAETHKKIDREIQQLANQFLQRKKNCLEVAFTYLLGEVDLESSTTFFKNVRDLDDELDGLADESSSESDEDIPAGGSASMSQELPPHNELDTALAPPNRTIVPPPPQDLRPGRPKNLISIHDFRGLLPSKEEFAREYAIFGDGAEVCEHNAKVAEKYNARDLVDVWRYLALLLKKGVPLEILAHNQRRDSILVIAHDVVSRCNADTSPLDSFLERHEGALSGRVKWGKHPLARDFIMDLFAYYEKIADIQMLAMLSCIFSESSAADSVAYFESHLPQPETPLPFKAPAFSLDYFPTDASLWNIGGRSYTNSAITTPMTVHTPVHYSGSQASDDGIWGGDAASNSYSCGETPPNKFKGYLGEVEAPPSVSTSPNTRFLNRANSGLASAFAANLPRSFAGVSSSSPPNHVRKRPSPAETILSSLAPGNVTWSASTAMDSNGGRTSLDDDDYRRDDYLSLVPTKIAVTMEDQTAFDDDGWLNISMLESSQADVHARYRYAYAEMLQMWNQPLSRLEIMKFNSLKEDMTGGHVDDNFHESGAGHDGKAHNSSPIAMGKKDQLQALLASGRGLDVTGMCRIHEIQLEPLRYTSSDSKVGGAVGTCDRCHQTQSQLTCVYCLEPVDALFPPCLACGCASHEACLAEWHAAGETQCPAGDECNCVEEAADGQVESWAALQGAMLKGQRHMMMLPGPALDDSEDDAKVPRNWERVEPSFPSRMQGLSAASISLGNRLRKSAGEWSRASSLKRNDRRNVI